VNATGYVLRAATVVTGDSVLSPGWVAVRDGSVIGVGEVASGSSGAGGASGDGLKGLPAAPTGPVVDLGERIVAPGYFDVHVHGGDGAQVNGERIDEVVESVARIARFHAGHGTTSLLATTVSDLPEQLLTTVTAIGETVGQPIAGGAAIRGIHLEGPFIARAKLGAHDPLSLRGADVGELRTLAAAAGGTVRMVTLAPELPGSGEVIAGAAELGIAVAIGHTDADFDTTRAAIDAGARHATHLFNAMAPLHHRRPGAVTALLLDDRVTLEVIADLEHVHPAVLELAARCAPGRLVAVSDAVPAAGQEPGTYQIGRIDVAVEAGRVTLASDPATLAGSVLTMDVAVQNLVRVVGLPLDAAIRTASSTPAHAAGCAGDGLGTLRTGSPADIVVLEPDLSVAVTIVAGAAVFDPAGHLGATTPAAGAAEPVETGDG
jgi:N-acetylglucosamine-6-phosphate deacetylase